MKTGKLLSDARRSCYYWVVAHHIGAKIFTWDEHHVCGTIDITFETASHHLHNRLHLRIRRDATQQDKEQEAA